MGLATSPSVEPRSSRAAHSAVEPVPESNALYWGGGGSRSSVSGSNGSQGYNGAGAWGPGEGSPPPELGAGRQGVQHPQGPFAFCSSFKGRENVPAPECVGRGGQAHARRMSFLQRRQASPLPPVIGKQQEGSVPVRRALIPSPIKETHLDRRSCQAGPTRES